MDSLVLIKIIIILKIMDSLVLIKILIIGERGSVGTCRIILNFLDREVQEKLVDIKNPPLLAFRYLDDVRKKLRSISGKSMRTSSVESRLIDGPSR